MQHLNHTHILNGGNRWELSQIVYKGKMKVVLILSVLWVCVENVYTCTCVDIPTNGCNSDYCKICVFTLIFYYMCLTFKFFVLFQFMKISLKDKIFFLSLIRCTCKIIWQLVNSLYLLHIIEFRLIKTQFFLFGSQTAPYSVLSKQQDKQQYLIGFITHFEKNHIKKQIQT